MLRYTLCMLICVSNSDTVLRHVSRDVKLLYLCELQERMDDETKALSLQLVPLGDIPEGHRQ